MTADRGANRPFIWDNVVPYAPAVGNDLELLRRFRAAGHGFVSLTVAGDDCGLAEAMHRLSALRRAIAEAGDWLRLATSVDDIRAARAAGQLAVGLHLEGTECLERDVDMLDVMQALGIRHAILAFNQANSAAGGCMEVDDTGLTRFGRRLLDRMREVGILLDVSHMSRRASIEAIQHIGRPAVFSHSNVDRLFSHPRNVTDEQARAAAGSGGLVGVSGSTMYLGFGRSLPEELFRHIDYLVELVGPDHVGLGTDYIVDVATTQRILSARPDEWPHDDLSAPLEYLPPEGIAAVIGHMEKAGYQPDDVARILGGNYARIAAEVWR